MYRYGMRARYFSIACQPMDGLLYCESHDTDGYYSIIVYDRKLTDAEIRDYQLDELEGEPK